jgi:hypothetical protein
MVDDIDPLVHPPKEEEETGLLYRRQSQREVAQVRVLTLAVRVPICFGPVVEHHLQSVTHHFLSLYWERRDVAGPCVRSSCTELGAVHNKNNNRKRK